MCVPGPIYVHAYVPGLCTVYTRADDRHLFANSYRQTQSKCSVITILVCYFNVTTFPKLTPRPKCFFFFSFVIRMPRQSTSEKGKNFERMGEAAKEVLENDRPIRQVAREIENIMLACIDIARRWSTIKRVGFHLLELVKIHTLIFLLMKWNWKTRVLS